MDLTSLLCFNVKFGKDDPWSILHPILLLPEDFFLFNLFSKFIALLFLGLIYMYFFSNR